MARGDRGTGRVTFDVIELDRTGKTSLTMAGAEQVQVVDKAPGWYWRVRATNGQTLAHSEVYEHRRDALGAIRGLVGAIRGDGGTGVRIVTHELDGGVSEASL